MAQRVLIRPDTVRISKPGIDVNSAAEKDLLISLGARNAQIIQRGWLPMPPPQDIFANPTMKKWIFTIYFPAQQSTPDLRSAVLTSTNADNSGVLTNFPPTQRITFTSSTVTIEFDGAAGPNGQGIYGGLIYALFRKRLDS